MAHYKETEPFSLLFLPCLSVNIWLFVFDSLFVCEFNCVHVCLCVCMGLSLCQYVCLHYWMLEFLFSSWMLLLTFSFFLNLICFEAMKKNNLEKPNGKCQFFFVGVFFLSFKHYFFHFLVSFYFIYFSPKLISFSATWYIIKPNFKLNVRFDSSKKFQNGYLRNRNTKEVK